MRKKGTKIWIWHEHHLWPRASCDRSWDAHQILLAKLFPPLGIGETVTHPFFNNPENKSNQKEIH